ncbi:MAG: hypothetical protein ACE5FK_00295 [Candidatus Methylomirabilia bacterium]
MNKLTLDTLTERLDRLERGNRRMKLVGATVFVALAALVVLGLVVALGAGGTASEAADEFGGQRFVVERDFLARIIQGGFDETASRLHTLRLDMQRGFETVAEDLSVIRKDIWEIRTNVSEIDRSPRANGEDHLEDHLEKDISAP